LRAKGFMSHSETLSPLGLAPPVLQNIRHLEAYSWGLILGHIPLRIA